MKGRRLKIKKLVFTSQERVEKLQYYVNKVLEILGHPEAYVTDESTVEHLTWSPLTGEMHKHLLTYLELSLGFSVRLTDKIVDVAQKLADMP